MNAEEPDETLDARSSVDAHLTDLAEETLRLGEESGVRKDSLTALRLLQGRWNSRRLPTVVVGEVSRGKSSLINALIARALLPDDMAALSSCWVALRYGDRYSATAYLVTADGVPVTTPGIARQDLPHYLTVHGQDFVAARHGAHARVQSIVITLPAPVLRDGLELLDTPGVGGLRMAHRRSALAALTEADAVVFVTKTGEPLSRSERLFLADAVERVTSCVLVHTFRDQAKDADAALAADLETLKDADQWTRLLGDQDRGAALARHFASVPGVSVSSKNALKALMSEDTGHGAELGSGRRQRQLARSGLPRLREVLHTEIVLRGREIHADNVVRLLEVLLREVETRSRERIGLLTGSTEATSALARREERVARWVEHSGDYWMTEYRAATSAISQALTESAGRRARQLEKEYAAEFSAGNSVKKITAAVDRLLGEHEAAYGDLIAEGHELVMDAAARVRGLMAADGLEGVLDQAGQARRVLDGMPSPDTPGWQPNIEDLPAVVGGGIAGVGVSTGATLVLQHAGLAAVGAAVPIVVPFMVGAAAFGAVNAVRRQRAKTAESARSVLADVAAEIRGKVLTEAQTVVRQTAGQVEEEITEAVRELGERVREDRRELDEARDMSPQRRQVAVEAAEGAASRAGALLTQLNELVNTGPDRDGQTVGGTVGGLGTDPSS